MTKDNSSPVTDFVTNENDQPLKSTDNPLTSTPEIECSTHSCNAIPEIECSTDSYNRYNEKRFGGWKETAESADDIKDSCYSEPSTSPENTPPDDFCKMYNEERIKQWRANLLQENPSLLLESGNIKKKILDNHFLTPFIEPSKFNFKKCFSKKRKNCCVNTKKHNNKKNGKKDSGSDEEREKNESNEFDIVIGERSSVHRFQCPSGKLSVWKRFFKFIRSIYHTVAKIICCGCHSVNYVPEKDDERPQYLSVTYTDVICKGQLFVVVDFIE